MKFNVGDKIVIRKPIMRMGRNHIGAVGIVTDLRCYGRSYIGNNPTHYVVKFECYKIPHIFMKWDIDESCEKVV